MPRRTNEKPKLFTVAWLKNGNTVRQFYVTHVIFNQNLPADFWDPDAEARKVKK